MTTDDDIRVQLARMEGKQDVANERLNNVQSDIADIRRTQNSHGDRLGILEAEKNMRTGERHAGKLMWSGISFLIGSGGVFAILEMVK